MHRPAARATQWTGQLQNTAASVGLKVAPFIPAAVKRLLVGGRSVTIDGNTLDPTLQLVLAAQRAVGIDGLVVDDDVAASRAQAREVAAALAGPEIHVAVTDVAVPSPAGDIAARHYRPLNGAAKPLLVYYHGGGFVIGDLDVFDAFCRLTCRDGDVAVLSVDYRRAPEHPAPAAVDDAYAAFRWAYAHAEGLGGVPGRVAVGGDSAGGNLAAVVSWLARDDARNAGGPQPVLQWLIYPIAEIDAQTPSRALFGEGFVLTRRDMNWFHSHYLDGSGVDRADPRVSPLLAEDLSGLPPTLIATAGFDPLRDEGERFAAALQAAGNVVDLRSMRTLTHAFINFFPLGGGCAVATTELISALRAHLSRV